MGPRIWSLGESFIPAYWQVIVFGLCALVDRPSDRLYLWTIPLCVFMERLSCYRVTYGVYTIHPPCMSYDVHSTLFLPDSRVLGFSGNARAQKLKAQNKQAKITG